MGFTLHPQLAADTLPIGDLPQCRLLLMNNANFPWLILVPRKENMRSSSEAVARQNYIREIFDLGDDYSSVMNEVRDVAKKFQALTQAHKMNIAALGNMVPQLHIHIIARFENDAAWPQPVWSSKTPAIAYDATSADALIHSLRNITNL